MIREVARTLFQGGAMTRNEWLAATDVRSRLQFVASRTSDRKLRLLACACARRVFPLLDARGRRTVELMERFADGLARDEERAAAYAAVQEAARQDRWQHREVSNVAESLTLWGAVQAALRVPGWCCRLRDTHDGPGSMAAEEAVQVRLTDCLFGDPFRPLPSRSLPVHVQGLAQSINAAFPTVSEDFAILADALEELGEAEAAAHCRQELHAKGCHVMDWITGKK
jgi:hypothetical protein